MCRYCEENISKREKHIKEEPFGKAELIIKDRNILKLNLRWFDNLRGGIMATTVSSDIDYCP